MGESNPVVNGAVLQCAFGNMPCILTSEGSGQGIEALGQNEIVTTDCVVGVNITDFGLCISPHHPYTEFETSGIGFPCMPEFIEEWQVSGTTSVGNGKAITRDSFLCCAHGGNMPDVIVIDDGQGFVSLLSEFELPSDLKQLIDAIIKGDLSIEEKADQIIKIYEDYLYNVACQEAFTIYTYHLNEEDAGMPDIQADLTRRLEASGIDIRAVIRAMGNDIVRATGVTPFLESTLYTPVSGITEISYSATQFINLVKPKAALDLKNRIYDNGTKHPYSLWEVPYAPYMRADYLGNYLFGYYGTFYWNGDMGDQSSNFLLYGAGAAQLADDKNPFAYIGSVISGNYGDNVQDPNAIKQGIKAANHQSN